MDSNTIAFLVYLAVLSILLFVSGFFSERFKYDKNESDGIVIASIFWPISLFAIPAFYIANWIYRLGLLASKAIANPKTPDV